MKIFLKLERERCMTIDNYIYFNNRFTNNSLNSIIAKINDDKNYELVLKNGPILGEITNNSIINLDFEFKYKNNECSKIIISLICKSEINIIDELLNNESKDEISNVKSQLFCDKFKKQIKISVVPKDDASYILFQLLTKEITQTNNGLALCYLYFKISNDEEEIKYISCNNVSVEIDDNISSLYSDTIYINNNNCKDIPQASWNKLQKETMNTDKAEQLTENKKINFKYSIIYLALSIIFFIAIILCCPTEYLSDAPEWYQKLSDFSFIFLMLNIPIFILPVIISAIKRKSK